MLPLKPGGVVDAEALPAMLDESVGIVTIQWANNETGVIHPLERIGAMCRERGVPLHTDATQLIGKLPVDVRSMPIDLLSLSAHKFYGPKGVGALYARRGVRFRPIMHGAQERERRGGTENTAGIVGMGVAADEVREWLSTPGAFEAGQRMRDRFEQAVLRAIPAARVNGAPYRLWNTSNIGFPTLEAEAPVAAAFGARRVRERGGGVQQRLARSLAGAHGDGGCAGVCARVGAVQPRARDDGCRGR